MPNNTITLSRDALKWAVEQLEEDGNKGTGYFDTLRAALAEPVPPAGGEPEVFDMPEWTEEDGFGAMSKWVKLHDHRAHVTRLQAEAAELRAALQGSRYVAQENTYLQSELTKARELMSAAVASAGGYLPGISEYLSPPAEKAFGFKIVKDTTLAPDYFKCMKGK